MNTDAESMPIEPSDAEPRGLDALKARLLPGQELVEEAPGQWVIRMEGVVAPPETWTPAGPPAFDAAQVQRAAVEHPAIQSLPEHATVRVLEVRDMGANSAHIDAEIEGVEGIVTAGCGVDQIMDRVDRAEREAWCKQVVWDHYVTNLKPAPPKYVTLDLG